MATTIQISEELHLTLSQRKLYERETFEEVIWDLIEDSLELTRETKHDLARARKEIEDGDLYTLDTVKDELGV